MRFINKTRYWRGSLAVIIGITAWIGLAATASGQLALDKVVSKNQTSASTSVTTAAFSTAQPGELLVAFVAADGPTTSGSQKVNSITGGSLTWTLRQRVNTQYGTSEIWQAVAPNVLTNVTVKATLSSSAVSSLNVAAFTDADTSVNGAVGAANAATGAPSVNLTGSRNGSWVWGVGNDWDGATARTVGSNQTKVSEYLASVGDTMWVQRQTTAGGAAGSVSTLNDTAPTNHRWNFAAIEILPAVNDTTAPSVPTNVTANATAPTNVNLNWSASTDDVGVTGYKVFRDGVQIGTSATTSYTDATAVGNTTYSYTVRAYDAAGNNSADSSPANVTTPAPDTTAPVITGIAANSITQTTATVGWSTDEPADTQVEYGPTTAYGSSTPLNATLTTTHSTNLTGLTADTTYHFRVKSKDGSGNLATSADNTFTTLAPAPDTTPPTTAITSPSNGSTVSGTVSVTANAADNVGVVGVQFKLDGVVLGAEDTSSPYSISWNTTTASNGNHILTSTARDAAGNVTVSSNTTVTVNNGGGGGTSLAIDGNQTFQTMDGFGTSINATDLSVPVANIKPAIDKLSDGGTRIWRVIAEQTDWEATNDDANPSTNLNDSSQAGTQYYMNLYNTAKFQHLWDILQYLKDKEAADPSLHYTIVLDFMGRGPDWMMQGPRVAPVNSPTSASIASHTLKAGMEDEWAETVSSALWYGKTVKGLQIDLFSPDNEPDWDYIEGVEMTSTQYAAAMDKVSSHLDALGLGSMHLVLPDTARSSDAVDGYAAPLRNYPNVMNKLDHYALHSYSGDSSNAYNIIKSSSYPNKNFWMSEFGTFAQGMANLGQNASALMPWDGYDSIYQHSINNNNPATPGNDAGNSPALLSYSNGVYTERKEYYQFAQLFKYVPAGSVRIGASQSNGNVTVYAFRDPATNRITIVGQNNGSTNVSYSGSLANLPAVTNFEYYVTDNTVNLQRGSDVAVSSGAFTVVAPAHGVFTLTTAAPTDQTPPTAPSNLQATGAIGTASLSWTAATDNVGVTAYNVYRSTTPGFTPSAANKIGQTSSTSYVDNAAAGTYYYQVTAQDAAANVSPASNEASASVLADTQAPSNPTNLQATSVGGQTVGLSWSASSDNVAVTGYKVYRNNVLLTTVTGTSYTDATVQPNTNYSYAVTAIDAGSNESGQSNTINVTTTAVSLAVDAQVVTHQTSTSTSITSPALSTTGSNELLVAFISADGPSSSSQSFSSVTTSGLTWTLRKRTNGQAGTSEIWTAVATGPLTNATVTATHSGSYVGSMVVTAFKGVNTSTIGATGGASAATGAPSASLTSTTAGSWVWGVGNDWDGATARTVGSGQTKIDEYLASVGDTFWTQRLNATSTAAGQNITVNDTAPTNHRWNLSLIEILPQ